MRCSKSSSKREVYSNTTLPQKTRKISNKQSNIILKGTRKRSEARRQWQAEINEIETKNKRKYQ